MEWLRGEKEFLEDYAEVIEEADLWKIYKLVEEKLEKADDMYEYSGITIVLNVAFLTDQKIAVEVYKNKNNFYMVNPGVFDKQNVFHGLGWADSANDPQEKPTDGEAINYYNYLATKCAGIDQEVWTALEMNMKVIRR